HGDCNNVAKFAVPIAVLGNLCNGINEIAHLIRIEWNHDVFGRGGFALPMARAYRRNMDETAPVLVIGHLIYPSALRCRIGRPGVSAAAAATMAAAPMP